MNIQAIVFCLTFVCGAIMIVLSINESGVTADNKMSNGVIQILRYLGIVITVIATCGLVYTFSEIIYRGHKKITAGHLGKLEKQEVEKQRSASSPQQRAPAIVHSNHDIV